MKFTYVKDNTNVSFELSPEEYRHTLTLLDNMDFDLGDKLTKTIDYALLTLVQNNKSEAELRKMDAIHKIEAQRQSR